MRWVTAYDIIKLVIILYGSLCIYTSAQYLYFLIWILVILRSYQGLKYEKELYYFNEQIPINIVWSNRLWSNKEAVSIDEKSETVRRAVHILWFHESLLFGSFDKYEQVQSEFLSLFGAVNLILPVKNSTSKLQTPFFRNLFILQ